MKRNFSVISASLAIALAATIFTTPNNFTLTQVNAATITNPSTPSTIETKTDAIMLYPESPYAIVNGERRLINQTDTSAVTKKYQGNLMVPLKFISETFGSDLNWNDKTKTASFTCNGKIISYAVGKQEMYINGASVALKVITQLFHGKTYVELNSIAAYTDKKIFVDRDLAIISSNANTYSAEKDKVYLDAVIKKFGQALPFVGTKEKFIELIGAEETYATSGILENQGKFPTLIAGAAAPMAPAPAQAPTMKIADESKSDNSYSETNVQVEGVDEADIIKTDGEYIFYVKANRVSVVKANPANDMKLESTITFADLNFYPRDMYLDDNDLIIIGDCMKKYFVDGYENYQTMTRAYVYDVSNKADPKKVREVESEGNYITSRKVDKSFYLITNAWVNRLYANNFLVPTYKDTAVSDKQIEIGYDKMCYLPNSRSKNFLFISGFELDKPQQEVKVNTFLGGGQNVYMSTENLYIAQEDYEYMPIRIAPAIEPSTTTGKRIAPDFAPTISKQETVVYKFALEKGNATFENKQSVPGTILNQFSMDEHNSQFRIATTENDYNTGQQKNGMYVLNSSMEITGKIENIAPGERIYSARFMGDRAYMVTFKNVDPLFVIDLKDAFAPKILGALKIPGYSNYLHPYDENHVIGFGKDTEVSKDNAFYQGVKISMCDVSDVANPKELFKENIGDRGTDSPLLYDHKALLFSKEKNLLAFPVTVATISEEQKKNSNDVWQYGATTFQGAYVYSLDLEKGFKLKGTISHISKEEMLKAGMYGMDNENVIQRILYIGENLYSTSQKLIKSTNLDSMKEVGQINLK